MKTSWIAIVIMLIAGAIASVIFLLQDMALVPMIINLELIMLVFYIFGKIVENKIRKLNSDVMKRLLMNKVLEEKAAKLEKSNDDYNTSSNKSV